MKKIIKFLSIYLLCFSAYSHKALSNIAFAKDIAITQPQTTISAININQNDGFADIVEDLLPATVNITTSGAIANGSGFIFSNDGYIVTNNHVIENSGDITVTLWDGSKFKPKIIGIDKKSDIAVLKINAPRLLSFVKFGDSSKTRIGDWVIIVGNPYGFGGSVSVGILSARDRSINNGQGNDFLQTDAAINKGSSGGPLFNSKGELIGISTALFSPSGGSVGISFAYPSSLAWPIIKQLKEQGEVSRGWIGVSVQNLSDEMASSLAIAKTKGAFVTDIVKDGPADRAGIIASDILVKFDDREIIDMKTLPQIVSQTPINKTVSITLLRRGKPKVVSLKIIKAPSDEAETTKAAN